MQRRQKHTLQAAQQEFPAVLLAQHITMGKQG